MENLSAPLASVVAALDPVRSTATLLTALVVPAVLGWFLRSAHRESRAKAGERVVAYPQALRAFTGLGWLALSGFVAWGGFLEREANFARVAPAVLLFGGLLAILFLEVFGVLVTWDGSYLYTRSPWRTPRIIPLKSVVSCDYSPAWQWYRLHTRDHGVVRLHLLARGIPKLLAALPCAVPPYPPRR